MFSLVLACKIKKKSKIIMGCHHHIDDYRELWGIIWSVKIEEREEKTHSTYTKFTNSIIQTAIWLFLMCKMWIMLHQHWLCIAPCSVNKSNNPNKPTTHIQNPFISYCRKHGWNYLYSTSFYIKFFYLHRRCTPSGCFWQKVHWTKKVWLFDILINYEL